MSSFRIVILLGMVFAFIFCGGRVCAQVPLAPFTVTFISGEETPETCEIRVFIDHGKVFATNVSPIFYVGAKPTPAWTRELTPDKIKTCQKFLDRARTFTEECPITSTVPKSYTIVTGNETLSITGDCDWEDIDFLYLRGILFYEDFAKLEQERAALRKDLHNQLSGTWYFAPITAKPEKGDILVLSRTATPGQTCTWQFSESNYFKSSCNEVLNLAYSIKYLLNMDGGRLLEIQGGTTTDKDGNSHVRNYGATYSIESVTPGELRLRYMWR